MDSEFVVQQQDAIAVYANSTGSISLMQRDGSGSEEMIWFSADHAEAIANAILRVAAEIAAGE